MFLLHGLSDDHTGWVRRTSIERYCDGLPLIVVMPDGYRGFYTDAHAGLAMETALAVELPTVIRAYFPVVEQWSVTGLSMGGYGALKFALKHPKLFGSTVSHSGALHFGHLRDYESEEFARIVPDSELGRNDSLFTLANSAVSLPRLRLDCGTEDHLLAYNRQFHEHLVGLGIDHEYEEFPGAHDWAYWDTHVQDALVFHGLKAASPGH